MSVTNLYYYYTFYISQYSHKVPCICVGRFTSILFVYSFRVQCHRCDFLPDHAGWLRRVIIPTFYIVIYDSFYYGRCRCTGTDV